MADEKKKSPTKQLLAGGMVVVIVGGLCLLKVLCPDALGGPLKQQVRDDEYIHCELHATKVFDAAEVLDARSSRYDYTFTCTAKQDVVISDLTVIVGETVTSRNTGVGKDEKSDRRLDSESVSQAITLKAGATFEKKGRLIRKSSIEGSRGYIKLEARLRFPGDAGKPGESPTAPKTFLKLRVPAAG